MNGWLYNQLVGVLVLIGFVGQSQVLHSQDEAIAWFNRGASAETTQEKITCYLKAIELNPKFIEAFYNLGYIYKNLGDYADAEKAYRQALLSDPAKLSQEDKLRINYELGITLKKLNRYNEAMETLGTAKNLAKQTEIRAAVLYELGRTKLLVGDFEGALAEFNEGLLLTSSKQAAFQSALQNINMLRQLETQYVQGINYLDKGQYDEAINVLSEVVKADPNYKNASQQLAKAQRLKTEQTEKDDLMNIYTRGIGYMKNNDWENALIAFKQVEQIDPRYKDIEAKIVEVKTKLDQSLQQEVFDKLYTDGMAEYRNGNWISAIAAFEKVRGWDPTYKNVDRMYRDAQSKLNQESDSAIKNRYYVQGKSALHNKNWPSAVANFEQLITLDPNYRDVQFLLQQAKRELEIAAQSHQLETYYSEGIDYFNKGNWLKAILAFEKIQQVAPNYQDVSEKMRVARNNLNKPFVADALPDTAINLNKITPKKEFRTWMLLVVIFSVLLLPLGIAFMVPTAKAKWMLKQGNYPKAALIYESLLMKKPDKVKLYPALANIYLLQNRNDTTAKKVYEIVLQMNISPLMKQKIDALTNQKYLHKKLDDNIIDLEQELRRELDNLRKMNNTK